MASGGGFSYKPNVNRNVTKKWRDAARPTYDDDDDWGDNGYDEPPMPAPAPAQRPGWGGQMPPPNRSFTNPSPPRSTGRPSFDRGDDRRYVSAGNGFDSAYPSTQRAPFPEPQHDEPPQQRFYAQHPALHINTPGQGPYPPSGFRPSSRGQHPSEAPFSAPPPGSYQRSHSGNRSYSGNSPGGFQPRQGSPARPDSRSSNTSSRFHPPRKSSLSQEHPPPPAAIAPNPENDEAQTTSPSAPVKALPFIRPADIYKRFEEEKEKERQSLDSQRPSLELDTTRSRDSAASVKTATSDSKEAHQEDSDSTRRLKPTLDTVVERKSEYGFDNMLKAADPTHPSVQGDGVHRQATTASSVYTDRPDPVSASTADDDAEPSSAFSYQSSIPPLGRISVFDPELTPAQAHTEPVPPLPSKLDEPKSTTTGSQGEAASGGLNHQASLGYRSVVQQAFDESQRRRPSSPTSTADTLPRSNSASTSELSPIISKRPDPIGGPSGPPVTDQPIPEEPSSSTSVRPLSESTIKGEQGVPQNPSVPAPPPIQPGYRRDVTPPSRGTNSPARQANIRSSSEIVPQQGIVTSIGSEAPAVSQLGDEERGRTREHSEPTLTSPSASQASGVSDEYQQWQAHSKQFNTKYGLGSSPATPSVTTPVTRAESPPKGTVKDLTGKYESNSGRSTPVEGQPHADNSRPKQQERMESFRPALPGGWQSFTTTGSQTPQMEAPKASLLGQQSMHQSTESVPTAKAPQTWQQGPANAAFAAAAAAGTALAGSFNGPAMTQTKADTSDDESENEWDQSSNSSQPEHSDTRDFASSHHPISGQANAQEDRAAHSYGAIPSDRLVKESTSDNEPTNTDIDYFPAPLRTSKSIEPGPVIRPPIPNVQATESSPVHETDEALQEEIVKSLTPRSSNFEGQPGEEKAPKPVSKSPTRNEKPSAPFTSESEDMYGGGSGQRTPAESSGQQLGFVPGHQPQYSVSSMGSGAQRPFLEQRFSWEMERDGQTSAANKNVGPGAQSTTPPQVTSPAADSPETIKAPQATEGVSTAATSELNVAPTASADHDPLSTSQNFAEANDGAPTASASNVFAGAMASSPTETKSFRNIMNMSNQQDRINALEANRATYNQSDGKLDQWIQSMQDVPEHSNIFQSNGRIWKDTGNNYNQPRLPSTRPMASITGSKVVQEDGKRLMAAAGRFGGKAGIAAKGLFAKGKDKLRSASTTDKGVQNRRKSTGPSSSTIAEESDSKRNSTFLIAPQIPAQDLHSSPIDGSSWFGSDRGDTSRAPSERKPLEGESAAEEMKTAGVDDGADGAQTFKPEPSTSSGQVSHKQGMDTEPPVAAVVPTVQIRSGSMEEPKEDGDDTTPTAPGQLATTPSRTENTHERKVSDLADDERANIGQEQLQPAGALAAPEESRNSSVSAVSSASPSPADGSHSDAVQRTVSPAEREERPSEPAPSYEELAPVAATEAAAAPADKDEEAAQERAAADDQNDPVPSYEETPGQNGRPQRIGPDAQILPVANLSQQRRNEPIAVSSRPFSFEATDNFQREQQAYEQSQQNQNVPSQPLSPISQTASKDLSQVSVEEVPQEQVARQNRQSRSYSRPFGADPVSDHPAFRQADQPIDRSQMYSTDAPPTNVRRVQEESAHSRQQTRPAEESGYRIPGPYGQEYRSPKPRQATTPSPTAAYSRQQSFPPSQETQPTSAYQPPNAQQQQYSPQVPSALQQQQAQPLQQDQDPSPPLEQVKPKKTFGAFLRGKTKPTPSPANAQGRGRDEYADFGKRPGMQTRDSRQESVTSGQSSFGESRDVVGQLPLPEKSKRRFSRDVMKLSSPSPTPPEQAQQVQQAQQDKKKKKRFSAMGNLFSRSDKTDKTQPPQRSTTLPSNSVQPDRNQYPQQYQDSRYQQQQFFSSSPAPGSYYGSPQQQDYMSYNQPTQPSGSYLPQGYPVASPQGYESRPSDLRIDTSGQGREIGHGHPATAPPVQPSYARNNSYQGGGAGGTYSSSSRTHSFTNKHPAPTTRAPISAPTGQSSIDPHVMSLHKRSRSPTMGRTSSEPERQLQQQQLQHGSDSLAPPNPARSSGGTPVDGLGTFVGKRISPVGGIPRSDEEQEAPFRIGIPGEDEQRRRTRQILIEQGRFKDANDVALAGGAGGGSEAANNDEQQQQQPPPSRTVADRMMNPGGRGEREPAAASATRAPGGTSSKDGGSKQVPGQVAELPGSKADGYESEEEILMSATVKPGDWEMPVFV